jgi:hypothetical protein
MQAQEHPYARWSVGQRMSAESGTASVVDAAFDAGEFLRTHVLRPTWHYVARDDLRWLMRLSGPLVRAGNARRCAELELDATTLGRGADVLAEALTDGPKTRRELAGALERRGISTADQRIVYLLMHAELSSVICSGPMHGKEHTYARFDDRVPPAPGPDGDEAWGELARRYFRTRGPATVRDFAWWAGLRIGPARAALALVAGELDQLELDGLTYWTGPEIAPTSGGGADLVQCYDEVIISYRDSRHLLQTEQVAFPVPRHLDGFTHVVLLDGRLLGHWRLSGGDVELRLARPLEPGEDAALSAAVERYRSF